ncbi:MAG: branched-chain amino acid ABC transporter permease [Acutalibacteraceae bacterium]|jgi:K+-transporting ATPase A subunit|nr:branched-chain amino acid ABC transporter permease [Acutalibacteraceae bacterium]
MDEVIVLKDLLLILAEILGAGAVVFGAVFAVHKWVLKQNAQDVEIKALKKEQTVICYGVLAALKGLKEQGCNGPVTEAINEMEKHLNQKAHQ